MDTHNDKFLFLLFCARQPYDELNGQDSDIIVSKLLQKQRICRGDSSCFWFNQYSIISTKMNGHDGTSCLL